MANMKKKNAWKHFYPEGKGKAKEGYVLHHKDKMMKYEDIRRYRSWNIEDLEMITASDHMKLHQTGRLHSEETKKKISASSTGRKCSEELRRRFSKERKGTHTGELNHMYGKHHSEDTKRKISEKAMGRYAGEKNPMYGRPAPNRGKKTPDDVKAKIAETKKGKHFYTNGIVNVFGSECPEGFVPGMTMHCKRRHDEL